MVFKFLSKYAGVEYSEIPNDFTIAMGQRIRKARLEEGLSQVELAEKAYFRQASISDIENGKREVSSSELLYFSYALNRPIIYFFPEFHQRHISEKELTPLLQELVETGKRLNNDDIKRIIAQAKALLNFNKTNKQKK